MKDRTIVIAFFGFLVAIGLLLTATSIGTALALMVLFLIGIFLALQPREDHETETRLE